MSERKYAFSPEVVLETKQPDVFFPNISISDPELIQLHEPHNTFQINLQDSEALTSLFANPEISKFKVAELRNLGKCKARVRDKVSNFYWAELLLLCDDIIEVRDINTEEEFLIDGEDILDEFERNQGKTIRYNFSLC